jgi:lysophospholipase L1-like esterase
VRQSFILLIPLLVIGRLVSAEEPIRERIEWADIWVTNADKDDLPRVLLVGDSITRGYFDAVEKRLAGKAYGARLATSKCVADPTFLDEVQLLLKQYRFAVIHFNNGLHGFGYTEEQYRLGLVELMATFQKHAPNAKLLWASSTPIRKRENLQEISDGTERVQARNEIAAELMKERSVPVDDLYGLVEQHPDWFSGDGVHFNEKGREVEAQQVAEAILSCLSAPATTPK